MEYIKIRADSNLEKLIKQYFPFFSLLDQKNPTGIPLGETKESFYFAKAT